MTKKLTFYKDEHGDWYVKLRWWPKILKPMLMMVAGADLFLEMIHKEMKHSDLSDEQYSKVNENGLKEVSLIVSTSSRLLQTSSESFFTKGSFIELNEEINDKCNLKKWSDGRFYETSAMDLSSFYSQNPQLSEMESLGNNIWLCKVLWILFGFKYPKKIYFILDAMFPY